MTIKSLLKVFSKMFGHCLFRIFLHLVIDGSIDTETVPVQIIFGTISLGVLVQPAIKCIIRPKKRVHNIILVLVVRRTFRFLGIHCTTEHISEIRADTGIVILNLI